jgi:hypothetical protein
VRTINVERRDDTKQEREKVKRCVDQRVRKKLRERG